METYDQLLIRHIYQLTKMLYPDSNVSIGVDLHAIVHPEPDWQADVRHKPQGGKWNVIALSIGVDLCEVLLEVKGAIEGKIRALEEPERVKEYRAWLHRAFPKIKKEK